MLTDWDLKLGYTELIHCQQYNIASHIALWYINKYHKHIWWQLVVHGDIDGYSQTPVDLKSTSNKQSCDYFNAFLQADRCYGLPSLYIQTVEDKMF